MDSPQQSLRPGDRVVVTDRARQPRNHWQSGTFVRYRDAEVKLDSGDTVRVIPESLDLDPT